MAGEYRFAYRDFDGDRQTVSIQSDITLATATAKSAEHGAFETAFGAWCAGKFDGDDDIIEKTAPVGGSAESAVAQSKSQLICEMQDNVNGRIYKQRLPFPDTIKADDGDARPAWVAVAGVTQMNPLHADYVPFKDALEAFYLTPNGNSGTLQRAFIEE